MGKIKKGILGGFSGKVGAVVGASWRGIDYMRGLPRLSKKPRSEGQNAQTSKMRLFRGFLLGIDNIVAKCFQNYSQYTEMNAALSYNMIHAVTGNYPEFVVDFPALVFAKGELLGSWNPKAISKKANQVTVSWKNRTFCNMSAGDNEVNIIIYDSETNQFHVFENVGLRSDKSITLAVPGDVSGNTMHCYLSFYSTKFKISSTNEYLGEIILK